MTLNIISKLGGYDRKKYNAYLKNTKKYKLQILALQGFTSYSLKMENKKSQADN